MISDKDEFNRYAAEYKATQREKTTLESYRLKDKNLDQEESRLRQAIAAYQKKSNTHSREDQLEQYFVKPVMRLSWTALFSAGIFIKENIAITAQVLANFLFPVHFAIDGARVIWDIYRTARDKTMPQRKTTLMTHLLTLGGLITASALVGLAITNPFALPITFLGIVGTGLYKEAYSLHQTRKAIATTKQEKQETQREISELKRTITILKKTNNAPQIDMLRKRIKKYEAKTQRLDSQLTSFRNKRSDLTRGIFFQSVSTVSVGLLITSAVLSIVFPPVAAVIASAGLMLFAGTAIASVMTNLPVVEKLKQAANWFKGLFRADRNNALPDHAYQLVPNDQASSMASRSNIIARLPRPQPRANPLAPAAAIQIQRRHPMPVALKRSKLMPGLFNPRPQNAEQNRAEHNVIDMRL
jgi:hypothetical protein